MVLAARAAGDVEAEALAMAAFNRAKVAADSRQREAVRRYWADRNPARSPIRCACVLE